MKFLLLFLVAIGSAGAVEQPQADINNYTAQYQHPILYPGDTLDGGWSGPIAYTIPTPAASTPTCSGASGADSGEYWIRDSAGVAELEQGTLGYSIYWVCPGDYRSSVGSTLNLADDGTSAADAGVVKVMCWSSDMTKNPVQRNSNWRNNANGNPSDPNHDFADECVLPKLTTQGHDYWFFHGLSFGTLNWTTSKIVRIVHGSIGVVLDRTWTACYRVEPSSLTNTSFACVLFEESPGDLDQEDSWIQNSVVGPCSMIYDADTLGVEFERDSRNNRVINTDIIDCGVGILSGGNATDGVGEGTIVENVSIIVSEHMRIGDTSCDHPDWIATGMRCAQDHGCPAQEEATNSTQRRIDISTGGAQESLMDLAGSCSCAQNLLVIKHGSDVSSNPFEIQNTRVSGILGQYSRCQGDGSSRGSGITFQENPQNTLIQNTIISARYPFKVANSKTPNAVQYENLQLIQNIFIGKQVADTVVTSPKSILGWSPSHGCPNCEYSFNAIAEIQGYESDVPVVTPPSGASWNCNTFRGGVTTNTETVTGQDNIAIDGADLSEWTGLTGTQTYTQAQAADTSFSFWDRLQSDPVSMTIDDIKLTAGSAYINDCTF